MELILELNSETHSSEDYDNSAQSYSDTDNDIDDITDKNLKNSGLTIQIANQLYL
jgi:hypothetical protein